MRLRFACSLVILLLLAAPVLAEPLNIVISPLATAGSPKALATDYLKRLLEERSSGRLQVTVDITTSDYDKALDLLKKQKVQLALPEISDVQNILPMLQIYELPFLFHDRQHLHRVIDNETGLQILQASQQQNLMPLTVWDGATRQLLATEALPLPGEISARLFTGTSPAVVNTTEDGINWLEIQLPEAGRIGEQEKLGIITLTNHSFAGCVLLADQDFWNRLPKDLKVIFHGAVKDATLYVRELAEQEDKKALDMLNKNQHININLLTAEQRELWKKSAQNLYSQGPDQVKLDIVGRITD